MNKIMVASRLIASLLLIAGVLFLGNSHAASLIFSERNYYIGLGVSQFSGSSREVQFGDFLSPTLVVGTNLNPYFGLEFRASGSNSDEKASDDKNYQLKTDYAGYLLAKYPFKPGKFSGHIRLGISNLSITGEDNTELKAHGKFSYGIGFRVRVSKHFALALDYEKVLDGKVGGYDSKLDSISMVVHRYF